MARYEQIELGVARRKSKEQLARLLIDDDANKFFTAQQQDSVVGYLWLIEGKQEVFLAYVYVLSRFRRRGYGEKMVKWAVSHAERKGAERLSLHVFAGNQAAIHLYAKCGFIMSNIKMSKLLT